MSSTQMIDALMSLAFALYAVMVNTSPA